MNHPVHAGSHALQRKCGAIAHMLAHAGVKEAQPVTPHSPGSPTLYTFGRRLSHVGTRGSLSRGSLSGTEGSALIAAEGTQSAASGSGDNAASLPKPQTPQETLAAFINSQPGATAANKASNEKPGSASLAVRKGQDLRIQLPGAEPAKECASVHSDDESGTDDEDLDEAPSWSRGTKVASLGAGSLFGELALLEDAPRNATIVCHSKCEVLTITKPDFVNILKSQMLGQKTEKLAFLRRHVPGMVDLSESKVADYAYLFKPAKFPKSHYFARQGGLTESQLSFLVKGSVEFRMESFKDVPVFCGLPEVGHRRLGCLAPGGMFGSLYPSRYEPFSIIATTSPCDTYCLSREDMKTLPNSILHLLRDVLDSQNNWRVTRCDSPAGSILGTVPRTYPCLQRGRKCRPRKILPVDLQEEKILEDAAQWDMAPGEILALKGKLPRRVLPHGGLSKSVPYLPTSGSRPSSRPSSSIGGLARSSRPTSSLSAISRPMTTPMASIYEPL